MKYLLTPREYSWRAAKSPTLIVGPLFPICDAGYRLTLRQGQADILFGIAGSCAEGHESLGKAFSGGEGGIRTHGTVSRTLAFEASAFNRSATSPRSFDSSF
jgi:hypothetical protein